MRLRTCRDSSPPLDSIVFHDMLYLKYILRYMVFMPKPGEILKILRHQSQLSQNQLAELIGVNPQHISHMETGQRGIGPKSRGKLAQVFGLPPEEFNRILACEGEGIIILLWSQIHTMPKDDVHQIIPILLEVLDLYELVRREKVPSDLWESLLAHIENLLKIAHKVKKKSA
jgi:transcriptional regulator with XRE-family HTH domain